MKTWIISNCESGGRIHEGCQDHTAFFQNEKIAVISLADGVSSSALSDQGAKLATEFACEEIATNFKKYYYGSLSSSDFVKVIQHRIKENCNEDDYLKMKCTLLFCAIFKDQYLIGHIGDGAIIYFGDDTRVISQPQENSLGGTATYTILDYNADKNIVFQKGTVDRCDGFLLTSDGLLGNVYYSGGNDVPQLAYDLFSSLNGYDKNTPKDEIDNEYKDYLFEYVQKDNQFSDDCSLAIVSRTKFTGIVDYEGVNGFESDVMWPCLCGNMNSMDEIRCSCPTCRKMYIDIYPETIVKINSKEGFFSRLNAWITSASSNMFDPENSAEIIDGKKFENACMRLRQANAVDETKNDSQSSLDEERNNQKDEKKDAPNVNKSNQKSQIEMVAEAGIDLGKMFKSGIKQLLGIKNTPPKKNKTKQSIDNKNNPIIELDYGEMIEAAYQLGYLPLDYVGIGSYNNISDAKKYIVKTMFTAKQYIDIFDMSCDSDNVIVSRIYNADKAFVLIADDDVNPLKCHIWNRKSNYQELLRNLDFSSEFAPDIKPEYNPQIPGRLCYNWNWINSILSTRRDSYKLFEEFCNAIDRYGKTTYSHLQKAQKVSWLVGSKDEYIEMLAFIIAKERLYMLHSVSDSQVSVEHISIETASQSINKFVSKYITLH